MKEKRWLGTQKYELHCFYCGGFHITGNCPQIVKAMNGWKYDRSCPETGHIKIVPNGDEYPTVLAFNGYHYRVVGLWGIPGRLLWLELERFYGDTIVAATFCPDELMEMDLGMSDDEQLSAWLGGLPFLSVSPSEFNGSEEGENLSGDVIVPVEKLEQDLEQYITLGSTGCRTIAEDVEFNRLHSKFLAALTNTTPYLSQDVIVPVEKLEAGRYRMMIPVEISTTGGLLLDRRDGLHGYSLEDYPNARFFKGW